MFRQYDPGNLLLSQAHEEVLRQELELDRLRQTLERLQQRRLDLRQVRRPTPLAFPLLVERFRESLSSEKLADRIRRAVDGLRVEGSSVSGTVSVGVAEKIAGQADFKALLAAADQALYRAKANGRNRTST